MTRPDDESIPPDVLAAAVQRELEQRRLAAQAQKAEARERREALPQLPARGRHRAVSSGAVPRRKRPVSEVSDRQHVPGALRHFRTVHGLTRAEALTRIGYSPRSSAWKQWEEGVNAPPYLALLKIIAISGLGYWTEHGMPQDGTTGDARLSLLTTAHRDRQRVRRRGRAHRRTEARDAQ
jgi:transcriptional regulator with XRE-family HTH domain